MIWENNNTKSKWRNIGKKLKDKSKALTKESLKYKFSIKLTNRKFMIIKESLGFM